MRKLFTLLLVTITFSIIAQQKPKLVVGIVVDQMRQDYLLRFGDQFGEGGFKRLINEGYQFNNAHYNYVPTYTAPGHASIYTGTTPSNHGIIGNDWYSKEKGLNVYCVYDGDVTSVGGSERNGKMSPKNLLASTITDELLLSSNFRSKVMGVSIKDRGSILPAGHNPTGAYWFDSSTGNFITSSYYTPTLPEWVENFNRKKIASKYLNASWKPLLPIDQYTQSTPDDVAYERPPKGKDSPTFPYNLKKLVKESGVGLIRSTPFGNSLVLDMALASIQGEKLGEGDQTDFLAVSFSSTDYIGHSYGPNSIELQDTYLRLDIEIKRFLDYLDANFGSDYLVFLTADHAVSNVPLYLMDQKMPAGYTNGKKAKEVIESFMMERFGAEDLVLSVSNDQVFLNHPMLKEKGLDAEEVQIILREFLLSFENVTDAFTASDLAKRYATSSPKMLIENGYNTKMSGDVAVRHKPWYIDEGYGKAGTTHGSGYTYDTHVPLLFFGSGIQSGSSVRNVAITDIAPTLSMILKISLPNSSTGNPLTELFD